MRLQRVFGFGAALVRVWVASALEEEPAIAEAQGMFHTDTNLRTRRILVVAIESRLDGVSSNGTSGSQPELWHAIADPLHPVGRLVERGFEASLLVLAAHDWRSDRLGDLPSRLRAIYVFDQPALKPADATLLGRRVAEHIHHLEAGSPSDAIVVLGAESGSVPHVAAVRVGYELRRPIFSQLDGYDYLDALALQLPDAGARRVGEVPVVVVLPSARPERPAAAAAAISSEMPVDRDPEIVLDLGVNRVDAPSDNRIQA